MNDSPDIPEKTSPPIAKPDPLAVLLSSTGVDRVATGKDFGLGVTVTNRGDSSAAINLWIEELSPPLQQWLAIVRQNMALAPDRSGEVRFVMHVPAGTLTGTYRYRLVIDAPESYPEDTPISRELELQVVEPIQEAIQAADPTYLIQPTSRSDRPISIQPGSAVALQVQVHNRSQLVDRFRLSCRDWAEEWIEVVYPREDVGIGEIEVAESLPLNPGEQGTILVTFAPPLFARAGGYVPTLQLHSEAKPDLTLLEPIYLRVLPTYSLQAVLHSLRTTVGDQSARYRIEVTNSGNSDRQVKLKAGTSEEDDPCTYTLATESLLLPSQQTQSIPLQVQPGPAWRRPLLGGGRLFTFTVDLEDPQQHPLTTPSLPGTLLWKARPWWQLLPFALLVLAIGLTLLVLALRWLVLSPPQPTIVEFAASDTRLAVANGDVVRLNWQINQAKYIAELEIIGRSPDGTTIGDPVTYPFEGGLPPELEPFCLQETNRLSCTGVRTDARRAGDYIFELNLTHRLGRGMRSQTQQTEQITMAPPPRITDFSSDLAAYEAELPGEEAETQATADSTPSNGATPELASEAGIALNWTVTQPEQVQEIAAIFTTSEGEPVGDPLLYPFNEGIPANLEEECTIEEMLVCQNVPTGVRAVGTYNIELQVSPDGAPNAPPRPRRIGPIAIDPPPQIVTFTANGIPVPPKLLLPIEDGILPAPLTLSWTAAGSEGTKVQLLPSPGDVPLSGSLKLPLSPSPASSMLKLQVTSPSGTQVVQAVTIETFDPTPEDSQAEGEGDTRDPLADPIPADPNSLSPFTFPPQFE